MTKISTKQKVLYGLSALLSLVIILAGRDNFVTFIAGTPKNKVSLSALDAEFQSLMFPVGDYWIGKPAKYDKNVSTGIDGTMHSSLSSEKIIDFYKNQLLPLGWKESSIQARHGPEMEKFCKNGMSLFVDTSYIGDNSSYYIELAWSESPKMDSYCPLNPSQPVH